MGITIHYHGTMADMSRMEELEDRVLDMALEVGGTARIWRSWPDDNPQRVIRGMILNLAPGQESFSLLVSPEGWLIPLHEIEAAEKGELTEPPYCWVKTQFGSVEGHVIVVQLLKYLKGEFFPDLEVSDEGEYWETGDAKLLAGKMSFLGEMINQLADKLRKYPLSLEAAEDPDILIHRIERVAQQVHASLARPPEHPPVDFDEEAGYRGEVDERAWDEFYKHDRRKQETMGRAIQEQLRQGNDPNEAFESAMRQEGLIDLPGEEDNHHHDLATEHDWTDDQEESWLGLPQEFPTHLDSDSDPDSDSPYNTHPLSEGDDKFCDAASKEGTWQDEGDQDEFASSGKRMSASDKQQHPSLIEARDLRLRGYQLLEGRDYQVGSMEDIFFRGLGDLQGGLAQALWDEEDEWEPIDRGLAIVQLKRALRGIAFADGALFSLGDLNEQQEIEVDYIRDQFQWLREQISQLLNRLRDINDE